MSPEEGLALIAEVFDTSPDVITPATARRDIAAWDSMGVLLLMAELDERFNLVLTPTQLEQLKKVDDILKILRDHNHITS